LNNWQLSAVILAPASILISVLDVSPAWAFALSAASLVPLASVLGNATEELARHLGPAAGGLLNASLANATELILGLVLLSRGQVQIVKASLSGSIIGNLLLVFGLAAFLGGLRRKKQSFSRVAAGASNTMLFLAVVSLVMPAFFALTTFGSLRSHRGILEVVSLWTAAVLLVCYLGSLVFTFRTHRHLFGRAGQEPPRTSVKAALVALVLSGLMIAIESAVVGKGLEAASHAFGWTDTFLGVVVLALVGNAAEHSSAVALARQDKMDLALSVIMGSSTQIALFVAPLLVVVSERSPTPMTLVFPPLEIAGVILSVAVVALVSFDGETNWLEGLQLLSVYAILALFFYFVPS
jgi:Ca2+:H+ antiporter